MEMLDPENMCDDNCEPSFMNESLSCHSMKGLNNMEEKEIHRVRSGPVKNTFFEELKDLESSIESEKADAGWVVKSSSVQNQKELDDIVMCMRGVLERAENDVRVMEKVEKIKTKVR